jgi:hypothetical protein
MLSRATAASHHLPFFTGPETVKSAWQVAINTAEQHSDPGKITALLMKRRANPPEGFKIIQTGKYSC